MTTARAAGALLPAAWVLLALCLGPAGAAERDASAIEPGHRQFAADYVAAVNSGDAGRLRRLVHPRSLACITDDNRDFFDEVLARSLRQKLSGRYTVASVTSLPPGAPSPLPPEMGAYPVAPTHRIQIDARTGPTSATIVIRDLLAQGGVWLEVIPCPTAQGLAAFRAARRAGDEQRARARALRAGLRDPLLAELRALLDKGQRVTAIERYRAASGEDLTVAKQVVDLLAAETP